MIESKSVNNFGTNIVLGFRGWTYIMVCLTHPRASPIPEYVASVEAFDKTCNLVLITSNGFTAKAEKEPAAQPERKEHQNTASPEK